MQWYYEKNGEQQGPVEAAELKARYESGQIHAGNLVWCQEMSDWASYASVFASPNEAPPLPGAAAVIRGTNGQTPNRDLRALARRVLSGAWGMAALTVFLWQVVQGAAGMVPLLGPLAQLAIGGAMMVGLYGFFLRLQRSGVADVGELFQGFSQFWPALGIYLLTALLAFLASALAALPGITILAYVAETTSVRIEENPLFWVGITLLVLPAMVTWTIMMLRYGMVYFIACDQPGIGVRASIRKSVNMMRGRKWKLFFLGLSFIGWHLLGMLALLVGLFWSFAYMFAAFAAFYDDLHDA